MSRPAIEIERLTKRFRQRVSWCRWREFLALDGVSLRVDEGKCVGLLGPNGSGKSTLLRVISTLLIPSAGRVMVGGYPISNVAQIKRLIGIAPPEARGFAPRLNARQNLEFYAILQGVPTPQIHRRIDELLGLVGLAALNGQEFWTLSTGQRQRLNLARALLQEPPILLFDEPTKGLDPWSAQEIRSWIRQELVEKQSKTLLVASNQMEEVRALCDCVSILRQGRLQQEESLEAASWAHSFVSPGRS